MFSSSDNEGEYTGLRALSGIVWILNVLIVIFVAKFMANTFAYDKYDLPRQSEIVLSGIFLKIFINFLKVALDDDSSSYRYVIQASFLIISLARVGFIFAKLPSFSMTINKIWISLCSAQFLASIIIISAHDNPHEY